jgi:aryl-alcohol dehydrogenase-like predicted oxidoreductase
MLDRQIESDHMPFCRENEISLMAYSSLVQGLLTGKIGPDRKFVGDDMRRENPRFRPENLRKIADFLEQIKPVAERCNASFGELAIAWTVANPPVRHVLVGARTSDQILENIRAADLTFSDGELQTINAALNHHVTDLP